MRLDDLGIKDNFGEINLNQFDPEYLAEQMMQERHKRASKYAVLPQTEGDALKEKLLNGSMSALGYLGGTLDKFGPRQIRAVASGHLEDLLPATLPFGDAYAPGGGGHHNLSWDDIITGKGRVLPQIIPENNPEEWEARDFAGPLLDIVAGPKLPRLGALTNAGKIAQKTGALPRTLRQAVGGFDFLEPELSSLAGQASPLVRNRFGGLAKPAKGIGENLAGIEPTVENLTRAPFNATVAPQKFLDAAQAAGTPYTAGTPLRSLLEVQPIPFGPTFQLGTGPRGLRASENISRAADKLLYARDMMPGVRNPIPFVRNLFNGNTGRSLHPEVQYSNETRAVPTQKGIITEGAKRQFDLQRQYEDAMRAGNLYDAEPMAQNLIRDRAENLPISRSPDWMAERYKGDPALAAPFQGQIPAFTGIGEDINKWGKEIQAGKEAAGLPGSALDEHYIDYALRKTPTSGNQSAAQRVLNRLWSMVSGSNIRRRGDLRNIPIGTTGINAASVNPNLSGPNALLKGKAAAADFLQTMTPDAVRHFGQNLGGQDILDMIPGMDPVALTDLAHAVGVPHFAVAPGSLPGPHQIQGIQDAITMANRAEATSRFTPGQIQARFAGSQQAIDLAEKAKETTGFLKGLSPEHAAKGNPLFESNPIAAAGTMNERYARTKGAQDAALDVVNRLASKVKSTKYSPDLMRLNDFANRLGMRQKPNFAPLGAADDAAVKGFGFASPDEFRNVIAQAQAKDPLALKRLAGIPQDLIDRAGELGVSNAEARLLEQVQHHGFPKGPTGIPLTAKDIADRRTFHGPFPGGLEVKAPSARKVLGDFSVPRDVAEEALANRAPFIAPHEIKPGVNLWDQGQSIYKALLYPIWYSSQVRNYVGGMYNNWTHDAFDPRFGKLNPRRYLQPQIDMANLLRGKNVELPPHLAHLAPNEGRIQLIRDMVANQMALQSGIYSELPGNGAVQAGKLRQILRNQPSQNSLLHDALIQPHREAFSFPTLAHANPLNIAGVGGRTEDLFSPVKSARKVGDTVENMLRGGQGLAYMRQGFTPGAAGDLVRNTHFDYRDLAPFEKNVARRLAPFYTFTRKNLPMQLENLLTNGDKSARVIRGFNGLRGNSYIPNYVGDGFAAPIGTNQDGTQRYLSQTGLPIEEAFEKLKLNTLHGIPLPAIGKTADAYAGMLNPILKGPLEQWVGRQFFTGRDLADLHPTGAGSLWGNLDGQNAQVFSQLLANTPATRFVSTLDKLTDNRKGLVPKAANLLTGFKISDVDTDKARGIDTRKALEAIMKTDPAISRFAEFYLNEENYKNAKPQTMELMRLFSELKNEAKARQKQARAVTGVQ